MRKTIGLFAAATLVLTLSACSGGAAGGGGGAHKSLDQLVVGFAQVGAESGWRTANTKDIQDSFKAANIKLQFSDAQQKQENQIKAIRSYIQQGVDYIAFSPVVQTGWDAVLNEAKAANIPVILTDRAVDSKDTSLYKTFLGSDFIAEGKKAGDWLVEQYKGSSDPVSVVQLEGTTGSAPAIDRGTGFADAIKANPNIKVVASQTGDFTRAGGKQVMEAMLKSQPKIDVVYAHNDDMGLGAIEAIEAAGKVPGKDIKIITVDGVKDGMTALANGKINFIVECSPLLGKQLIDTITKLNNGETVPQRIVTEETTFTQDQAKEALPNRKY
ncbi:MAG: ABC transporter substrate-binding protein [Propionibacteriaceae bacterium]|nr:ABC transporter substrate-binding protein [Propionibacteriaceae bacterium]